MFVPLSRLNVPTVTGVFMSRLKSAVPRVTWGCPADNNPCSTLPTCEHIPALDQEFTFDKAEAVYTMPGAMALLRRYRKLAQPQGENRQHHRDHRGGRELAASQHHKEPQGPQGGAVVENHQHDRSTGGERDPYHRGEVTTLDHICI